MEHIPIRPPIDRSMPKNVRAKIATKEGRNYNPGFYDFFKEPTLLQKEIAENVHRQKDIIPNQTKPPENQTTGEPD